MQIIITGKNMQVSDNLEEHIRKKISKLERHLSDPAEAQIELSMESTKNVQQRHVVQVTIHKNGTIMRGEERAADIKAALDIAIEKLERQIKRYKEKGESKKRRAQAEVRAAEFAPRPEEPAIIRTKRFRVAPITPEQAIDQMELLGHSFFVFLNIADNRLNIVYKREDENYGLLEPETE